MRTSCAENLANLTIPLHDQQAELRSFRDRQSQRRTPETQMANSPIRIHVRDGRVFLEHRGWKTGYDEEATHTPSVSLTLLAEAIRELEAANDTRCSEPVAAEPLASILAA